MIPDDANTGKDLCLRTGDALTQVQDIEVTSLI